MDPTTRETEARRFHGLSPDDPTANHLLIDALANAGRADEALACALAWAERRPDDADALTIASSWCLRSDDRERAHRLARAARVADPSMTAGWMLELQAALPERLEEASQTLRDVRVEGTLIGSAILLDLVRTVGPDPWRREASTLLREWVDASDDVACQFAAARLDAAIGDLASCFARMSRAARHPQFIWMYHDLRDITVRFGATGNARASLDIFQGLQGLWVPSFVVALRLEAGEDAVAPTEVMAVAEHLRNQMAHLRRSDDPWRADTASLPVTTPHSA